MSRPLKLRWYSTPISGEFSHIYRGLICTKHGAAKMTKEEALEKLNEAKETVKSIEEYIVGLDEVTYKVGDKFSNKDSEHEYMLVRIGARVYMINRDCGYTYGEGYADLCDPRKITKDEFRKITEGSDKCFTLIKE